MLNVQRIAWPLIVVLALSAGAVWCVVVSAQALPNGVTAAQPKATPDVQKWEYRKVNFNFEKKSLNDLGDEGWELVAVVINSNDGHFAYLKRRK